ncbi:hypothetical protein DIPPA_03099 [Diplonema papillatum]|nr:hypothetical protein DIPPA_03099 [Diplonema papillatum]
MLVKIKAPNGPLSLDVSPMDTVAEVMERVEREDGAVSGESVSRGECVLVKDKAELLMHMTLEECGVARNDVLKVQQVVLKGLKARRRKNPPRLRHGSFAEYSSEELTPSHQRVATPPYVSVLSDRRSSKSLCAKLRTERLHLLDVATNNLQATQQQSLQPPLSPTISASPTLVTFPLKVKTTTGKMIKVNVSASDTMNAVMTKVRRKWSLTPGEHCIAKIDENGIVPLQETETASVSGLAQGSIVLLTGSTSQCPMYDAAASDSLIDVCLDSSL